MSGRAAPVIDRAREWTRRPRRSISTRRPYCAIRWRPLAAGQVLRSGVSTHADISRRRMFCVPESGFQDGAFFCIESLLSLRQNWGITPSFRGRRFSLAPARYCAFSRNLRRQAVFHAASCVREIEDPRIAVAGLTIRRRKVEIRSRVGAERDVLRAARSPSAPSASSAMLGRGGLSATLLAALSAPSRWQGRRLRIGSYTIATYSTTQSAP